ncbi:hypothetical protein JCM5350_006424 [Sporobolomyces pararoseus]
MSHQHLPSIAEVLADQAGFRSDEESEEEPTSASRERDHDTVVARCFRAEIDHHLNRIVVLSSTLTFEKHNAVGNWRNEIQLLLKTPKNPLFNYYTSGKEIQGVLKALELKLKERGIAELFDGTGQLKKEYQAEKIVESFELKAVQNERFAILADRLKVIGENAEFGENDSTFVKTWRNPIFHSIVVAKRFSVGKDEEWYKLLAILHQTAAEIQVSFVTARALPMHPSIANAGGQRAGGSSSTQNSLATSRSHHRLSRRKLASVYQDLL